MIKITSLSFQANISKLNNSKKPKNQTVKSFDAPIDTLTLTKKAKIKNASNKENIAQMVQETAQKIQLGAKDILNTVEEAQVSYGKIKFFTYTQETIYEALNSLYGTKPLKDGTRVIEKLADDKKTVISRATLENDVLTIDNFAEKTRIIASDGELEEFYKGVEFSNKGIKKANECFGFANSRFTYYKNAEFSDDMQHEPIKAQEGFCTYKEIFLEYKKGIDNTSTRKAKENFRFTYGKLVEWAKDFETGANDCFLSAKKKVDFDENGKISSWLKNYKLDYGFDTIAKKAISIKDGKVIVEK